MIEGPTEPLILDIQAAPNRCQIDLLVPADLLYFTGHFDGFPILPGVVQLHWSLSFARRYLALAGAAVSTMQVKFRKPIRPDMQLQLTLTRQATAGQERLTFEYRRGEEPFSSGRIVL
jgi:3-hydroxymyristoyl/3-hydroxydecanoyl-(acyl carrier protein) dehydratase